MVRVLLIFLWLLIGAAFLIAVAAFARTRRASKRLERLSESYWELRYEQGQLRARIARLEPAPGSHDAAPQDPGGPDPARGAFVPLSTLKRPHETTVAK